MSKLTGDWDRARKFFNRLPNFAEKIKAKLTGDIAKEIEIKLREDILNQELDLAPLSEEYASRTEDERILIDKGEYIEGLKVVNISERNDTLVIEIGASNNEEHSSGLTMGELAQIINYGTANTPPRPHIKLSWEKMKRGKEKATVKIVEEEFKDMLGR